MDKDDMLYGMIIQILDTSTLIPDDLVSQLTGTLDANIVSGIDTVMRGTIFATGASLLTLFMLMEMITMINRFNSDGGIMSVRLPANMIIKFAIFAFLYCNLGKVLNGIQAVVSQISKEIVTSELTAKVDAMNEIRGCIDNLGLIETICFFVVIVIVYFVVAAITLIVKVTTYFRIFEIAIMYMFAPIPLSTLASQEFRSVAINYLKSFVALCLQGAIILACFKIFSIFLCAKINEIAVGTLSTGWDVFNTILTPALGYICVLGVAVFASGRIAKSLINAM